MRQSYSWGFFFFLLKQCDNWVLLPKDGVGRSLLGALDLGPHMCSTNAETLLACSVLFWCGWLLLASWNCLCLAPSHMHFPLLLAHCAALNTDNNFWKRWEHLLPPFSPQGLRSPPSIRKTWKLWKPAKPLPPRWTTRTLWKTDNYFYLCRLNGGNEKFKRKSEKYLSY